MASLVLVSDCRPIVVPREILPAEVYNIQSACLENYIIPQQYCTRHQIIQSPVGKDERTPATIFAVARLLPACRPTDLDPPPPSQFQ